jgi:ABC-type dipeptide/oligopeptide/nickel transport system ATPase component
MTRLLDIKKLSVHYYNENRIVKAVKNVDLNIEEGEIVGILGESGSGKSTLAHSIMRLIDPPGKIFGEIAWRGKNLLNLTDKDMTSVRGQDIAMVFQDPFSSLNPVIKVGEQIAEALRYHKGLGRREAMLEAEDLLKMVNINDAAERINDYPHQFSGGMQQRVSIAMAYALKPKLLIADEPTTALDVTIQKSIIELLKDLKTTMLFISHNVALVSGLCSRIYVMNEGRIVEEGPTNQVLKNPKNMHTVDLVTSFREITNGPN